ncbi:MAG: glycosyltransferase family 2 protein [Candidatus Gottesmanbacteria bacterium]
MPKVFIIILNWNGKKDTIECLESIKNMEHETWNMKPVVVDNGSADGSVNEIEKLRNLELKDLKIIANKTNLGFAEGNNVGIRYALENGADYILFLNNDTIVDQNLVKQLLKVMEENPSVGIAGPKIYFASGFEFHHDRYREEDRGKVIWYAGGIIDWMNVYASHRGVDEVDHGQYNQTMETDFVSGCAMIVRCDVFKRIGLFDKKYFLYWEDNDFCQRAKKKGFKIFYYPPAFLWHKNAASSNKPGSNIHLYYQTRNRLLFGLKYAPWKSKLALFRESIKFLFEHNICQQAIKDFYLARFGAKHS